MIESKIEITDNDHIVVTEPDRYFQDAVVVLLVDWPPDLLNQAMQAVKGFPKKIAIHIFNYNDYNYNWLIDVANQSNLIAINLEPINHIDLFKGYIIGKSNTFYFGRLGTNKIFTNFTNDPIGHLLVKLGEQISQMEEK